MSSHKQRGKLKQSHTARRNRQHIFSVFDKTADFIRWNQLAYVTNLRYKVLLNLALGGRH